MIQCFVVYHKLCFSHIKWSAIREYSGRGGLCVCVWGGGGGGGGAFGASGQSLFAQQELCWLSRSDRQLMSVFRAQRGSGACDSGSVCQEAKGQGGGGGGERRFSTVEKSESGFCLSKCSANWFKWV